MRQIGVLPDAIQARTLADHLLTLRIETRLVEEPGGMGLWVCDEDRVPKAREELELFLKDPKAERYITSEKAADAIREEEDEVESEYQRRQSELRQMMLEIGKKPAPLLVTWAILFCALVVSLATQLGQSLKDNKLAEALLITPVRILDESEQGVSYLPLGPNWERQPWRLVTPIFLHFGLPHLVFNLLAWHQLAGTFEIRRGSARLLLFTIVAAIASNIPQYYFGFLWEALSEHKHLEPRPIFGGLSGVIFALFGYIWIKSRLEPASGFVVTPNQVVLMIGWFFLCFTGAVGPIANVAHTAGLIFGMLVAAASVAWHTLRHTDS